MPGVVVHYLRTDVLPAFESGADQVWHMPGPWIPAGQWDYVEPSSAPGGVDFPDATVARVTGPYVSYYVMSKAALYLTGTYFEDGTLQDLIDMQLEMVFPCTYGTTWTDGCSIASSPGGPPDIFQEPRTWTADGYGTVIGNGAQLTNVLKLRSVTIHDTILSGSHQVDTTIFDRFWHASYPGMVAYAAHAVSYYDGEQASNLNHLSLIEDLAMGSGEAELPTRGIRLTPNPAGDAVLLTCGVSGDAILEVFNAMGQQVHRSKLKHTPPGLHQKLFDLTAFKPGVYTVRIAAANGGFSFAKLMIER